jgi:ABC-2 type transport system permease protein
VAQDILTVLRKEASEFLGNVRTLRVFFLVVLISGLLPSLSLEAPFHIPNTLRGALSIVYVVTSAVVVVAQTAPDLVIRERSNHTLESILASRLPDGAIFTGKALTAALMGYAASLLTMVVQLAGSAVHLHHFRWLYLASATGRWLALGAPLVIAAYMAAVGTFVALRILDQWSAYMITVMSLGLIALPFALKWISLDVAAPWLRGAVLVLAALDAGLMALGGRLFRRELLVLYL